MSEGGFRGGVWDDTADVEYTFCGVGQKGVGKSFFVEQRRGRKRLPTPFFSSLLERLDGRLSGVFSVEDHLSQVQA